MLAHRTEQDADDLTVAPAADHQEVSIFGLIDEYLTRPPFAQDGRHAGRPGAPR